MAPPSTPPPSPQTSRAEPTSGPELVGSRARRSAPPPNAMVRELDAALAALLDHCEPSVDAVADALRVSTRTLQRRLTQAGTTFERELDRVRMERARALVAEGVRLRAIAASLGYAHVRSFLRAFRRWTGTTPSAFRARASESDLPPGDLAEDAVGDDDVDVERAVGASDADDDRRDR